MNRSLIKEKLKNMDIEYKHPPYFLESKLLSEISLGLLSEALTTLTQINELERASLSSNSLRSIKNSMIASCTIFTRAIIRAGVTPEDAFDLSDIFIKKIETFQESRHLEAFEYEMVKEFVGLVNENKTLHYSQSISKIIRYISENATSKITVKDLAQLTHLSPDYLSSLFHKEVGISISAYIQERKIAIAKNFLEFSPLKITDIAYVLDYCNSAYFSNVFKKQTGMSPAEYRRNHT
jgi:YesN/AraC family two-component response regulator